ncbi:MAG TPA: CoA ester lyase [Candidatus Limnocylindrales bacterium]|nr:CoA ester lyase [Candidatus Limnocylindrales bacterium]
MTVERVHAPIRSALFTPGTQPDRLRKATQSGADICIFDLEDSVPAARVDDARRIVAGALRETGAGHHVWVRVHAASDRRMVDDIAALPLDRLEGIVLPKADDADAVEACASAVAAAGGPHHLPIIAIIESAAGVLHGETIARAGATRGLALGRFDLAADLGIEPHPRTPALSAARAVIVLASAAARLWPPLDSPWLKVRDLDGLREAGVAARRDGFGGMLLIHPSHVEPVNAIFSPTPEETGWARGIVAASSAAEAQGSGAFTRDGEMVDEAVVRRARRILGVGDAAKEGSA